MTRFIKGVAVAVVGLVLAGAAQAHGGPGPHGGSHKPSMPHGPHGGHNHGPVWGQPGGGYPGPFKTGGHYGTVGYKNYHQNFGVRFNAGFYYPGRTHSHWARQAWLPQYGCQGYWCPSTQVWYYWCQPDNCYYPVTHCPYGKFCW